MACADAVDRGFLADNPVQRTQAPMAAPAGTVGWTADEVERFLAASAGHRLGAAFHLAVVAGLRRGELLGLRWSDLDLDAARLSVTQQLMIEGGRARLKSVPDRDRRTVPLQSSMMRMLLEHRKRRDAELAGDAARADDDLVFRAPGGGWLTPERFTRVMDELIRESRVRRIPPNGLRRAGCLLAHRAPIDEAEHP